MKKVAIVTATRAEYGLLRPVIEHLRIRESQDFRVELIVTGTHLSPQYGSTIREIEADGLRIDHSVEIPVRSASAQDISNNQAVTLTSFTALFQQERYDAVLLLGDRYEMLAIAIAAGNTHTPIFHLCGGDTTEGAMDEWIRHAITKMSFLHFPTNEESRRRVIQLGEDPQRVFNFGSTGIDNVLRQSHGNLTEILKGLGLAPCDYAVCTYHPVTLSSNQIEAQMHQFLDAIRATPMLQFIVTKSNADQGGQQINELLDEAAKSMENLHVYASLGVARYLTLVRHAKFVLGNSSSGIAEAPALHVPTVNIGDRQRGRLQSESIINCGEDTASILAAMQTAMTPAHQALCRTVVSPYGDGHAAERIAAKTYEVVCAGDLNLAKSFYTIHF